MLVIDTGHDLCCGSTRSCGSSKRTRIDLSTLVAPSDLTAWILVFICIVFFPVVHSFLSRPSLKSRDIVSNIDKTFTGIRFILEQPNGENSFKSGLFFYFICTLLATLVLTNSYRGDNIKTLTQSFKVAPIATLDQLVSVGYKRSSWIKAIHSA